ncbi:MAG: hypothetical protein KKC43_13645, partial [Alphaproteobacteria bacterium]|nr:hypothetical protein [Alphaproteobacteria bacterium]
RSGLQRSHMKTTDLLSDPHRASMPPLHANKRIMLRRLKRGLFQQPAKEGKLFVFINVKNVGHSPAIVTKMDIGLQSVLINNQSTERIARDQYAVNRVIPAEGSEVFSADWTLDGFDLSGRISPAHLISVAGVVTYTTVFGAYDKTHFFASNINPPEYFSTHEENVLTGSLQVYARPDEE